MESLTAKEKRAPFGVTLAFTITIAVGIFLVIMPLALLLIPATPLPPPFPAQHQDAETLLFLLAFALILPLSLVAVPRYADGIVAGPNKPGLSALAGCLSAGLIALLLFVKLSEHLSWGGGLKVLLATMVIWCFATFVAMYRAVQPLIWRPLQRLEGHASTIWAATALLAVGLIFSFADLNSIAIVPFAIGIVITVLVLAFENRSTIPRVPRPWGYLIDGVVASLLFLAVPNLVIFSPEDASSSFETTIIHFHQDFFLGPANQVLGGGAMLVDTLSQYGVGSIYFLTAWFQLAPIGNGTLGLLEGILSALVFVTAYFVLRIAGVTRLLASCALAVGVIALVYALIYPIGGLLQHGSLRFGLPMALLFAAVAEARWLVYARAARLFQLAVVGISAIWALEGFAYTLITLAGIVAVQTWMLPVADRRRSLLLWTAGVIGACLVAHLLFAAITLLTTGHLPDWGWYVNTLREFLIGEVGDLTYDFMPWTPGIAVGALLLASTAAIILLIRRAREIAGGEPALLIAIAGSTAYGVALFSYFVNRSADHILPYICLPAIMVGGLWLSLLIRSPASISLRLRRSGLAFALATATLLVSVAWSSVDTRFPQSALAIAPPGGQSLRFSLDRLWHPPDLSPGASEGVRLLERYMPGEDHSLVVTDADLGLNVLTKAKRASTLPFGDPWEDGLVPDQHLGPLGRAISKLRPGERILLDAPAIREFGRYRKHPELDPLDDPGSEATLVPSGLSPLQKWVLKEIGMRFRLNPVATGTAGLVVAELAPRSP